MGCGVNTDSGVTRLWIWGLIFFLIDIVNLNKSVNFLEHYVSSFNMFYVKNTAYTFREKVRIGALGEKKVSEELSKLELSKEL